MERSVVKEKTGGSAFCSVFGASPRNRVIEFFIELRELDFSAGDVARETGLNRATAYTTMGELVEQGYLVSTRKVSGSQLYKLNQPKAEVSVLIDAFNIALRRMAGAVLEKKLKA